MERGTGFNGRMMRMADIPRDAFGRRQLFLILPVKYKAVGIETFVERAWMSRGRGM